jgi:predicted nucleic acid-binding protein
MIYFDTAYLAKCYLNEPGSDEVRAFAATAPTIACCHYGQIELVAVFHRHLRETKIDRREFRIVFAQYQADQSNGIWRWLPVTRDLIERAAECFRILSPGLFLRAADAVHLTCANQHGFREIYSNDRHLLAACSGFGIAGKNIL